MTDLEKARALIIRHEGCRLKPYVDTTGHITIGYGYNLTDRGITQQQADDWLDDDLVGVTNELLTRYPWFHTLSPARQAACIDLMFNVGPEGFAKFRHFIAAMVAGDLDTAANEVVNSTLAPRRRGDLARMIRVGIWL